MGAHQKIDRVARRELAELLPPRRYFPAIDKYCILGRQRSRWYQAQEPSVDEPCGTMWTQPTLTTQTD